MRSMNHAQPIRPRLASLFEPVAGVRLRSFETKRVGSATAALNSSPEFAGTNEVTNQTKTAVLRNDLDRPAMEASRLITRIGSPDVSTTAAVSPAEPAQPSESIRDQPFRPERVSTPDIRRGQPEIRVEAKVASPARREQNQTAVEVDRVIETTLVERLLEADQNSPAAESELTGSQSPNRPLIVRPEVTAASAPPTETKAALSNEESSIRITIGRVDVRAIMPPPPVVVSNKEPLQRALSLDDYLKRCSGDSV